MRAIIFAVAMSSGTFLQAQQKHEKTVDLNLAVGSSQGSFAGYYLHNWKIGKHKKIQIGLGGRFTAYLGANQYYSTAPAKLTSGATGPGVLFLDNVTANIDTFLLASPQVFAINAMINLGYDFTDTFSMSFNIDAIGFSFGSQKKGNYINGFMGQFTTATPTPFNILLISDNDWGTLNSELTGKYKINEKWAIKIGVQFLFTEYTTTTKVQQAPEANDRFRNKSLMFSVGSSFKI